MPCRLKSVCLASGMPLEYTLFIIYIQMLPLFNILGPFSAFLGPLFLYSIILVGPLSGFVGPSFLILGPLFLVHKAIFFCNAILWGHLPVYRGHPAIFLEINSFQRVIFPAFTGIFLSVKSLMPDFMATSHSFISLCGSGIWKSSVSYPMQ